MKTTHIFLFVTALCFAANLAANPNEESLKPEGKEIYIPEEFKNDDFNNPDSRYSYHRMAYTDDIVVFWEKGFGKDLSKAPDLNGKDMTVDLPALLRATQRFYDYYKDTLAFITAGSKADKYRMMVMINYSEEGTAYGGAYDNVIGALWVTPSRLHDKKFNCIAHELGHSFQAQIGADGLEVSGGGLWEYTSQWMLWQVNPLWMTDENYHWIAYMDKTHKSLFSFENMYCSPYMLEYWSGKHGLRIVTRIWRESKRRESPIDAYQRLTGITQEEFNEELMDAALRYITYDMERVRTVARPYINRHNSTLKHLVYNWYSIDNQRTPENYGYNGIALKVPEAGEKVTVTLEGTLPENASGEWKYALLPVINDTLPLYLEELRTGTVQGHGRTLTYKIPKKQRITHLWLVVSSAPADNSVPSNTLWPYRVKLAGTKPAVFSGK